jgi:hypothetical protein
MTRLEFKLVGPTNESTVNNRVDPGFKPTMEVWSMDRYIHGAAYSIFSFYNCSFFGLKLLKNHHAYHLEKVFEYICLF